MYIKNGNIMIAPNLNDVKKEIQEFQHILTFEKKSIGFYSEKEEDISISMVCGAIKEDLLFVMDCSSSLAINPKLKYSEDEEDKEDKEDKEDNETNDNDNDYEYGDYELLKNEYFTRTYMDLGEELYNLGDDKLYRISYDENKLNDSHEDYVYNNVYSIMQNKIYNQFSFTNLYFDKFTNNNSSVITYLPVELNNDTCLVFHVTNKFFGFTKWDVTLGVCLITRKSNVAYSLSTNFHQLYEKVKNLKKDFLNREQFDKFDEILKLIKHDIQKHIELDEKDKLTMLSELLNITTSDISLHKLNKLFSHFYENEELNVKISVNSLKDFHQSYVVHKDGERIYSAKSDPILHLEILKADAIYIWENNQKNGISPYDGQLYSGGTIIAYPPGSYIDAGGIVTHNKNSKAYYINYDGIYVQRNSNHEDVIELLNRKELYETLIKD